MVLEKSDEGFSWTLEKYWKMSCPTISKRID